MGVEGKLKGGGVTTRLTPCLHIVFRNSTDRDRGVARLVFFASRLENIGGVTLYLAIAASRNPATFRRRKSCVIRRR